MGSVVHTPVTDPLFGEMEIRLDHEGGTLRIAAAVRHPA